MAQGFRDPAFDRVVEIHLAFAGDDPWINQIELAKHMFVFVASVQKDEIHMIILLNQPAQNLVTVSLVKGDVVLKARVANVRAGQFDQFW